MFRELPGAFGSLKNRTVDSWEPPLQTNMLTDAGIEAALKVQKLIQTTEGGGR